MKNDKYLKKRGGKAVVLDILCKNCGKHLFVYQKDGVGSLKRCYLNRILKTFIPLGEKRMSCPECDNRIGILIIHTDGRKALRLQIGSIAKRRAK